jgi:hypothetical protein
MRYKEIIEGVGIITKQNQTPDVGPNQTKIEAAKLGLIIDKNGRPPLLHSSASKNSNPNKLNNLGIGK